MKIKDNKSYIALAALTVFGNGAFVFKFSSINGEDFISSVLGLILTALLFCLSIKFALWLKTFEIKEKFKNAWSIVFILSGMLSLIFAFFSLVSLSEICINILAEKLKTGFVILTLILTVLAVVSSRNGVLTKFALILFPVVFGLTLLIFLFSTPYMSVKYLTVDSFLSSASPNKIFEFLFISFFSTVLPLVALCIEKPSSVIVGGTIGATFLTLCIVHTILIFGAGFASELTFPYARAVGTVSLGDLFFRMDIALYPVCFFSGLVCTVAQTLAAIKFFKKAKNIRKLSINY